jgi:hypothetical protein
MASVERPSPAPSDDTTTTVSDEHLSLPSSPSTTFDSAPESDVSAASSLFSDGSSGPDPEPIVSRKPRPPQRSWPDSDEIALLEAVASHRQKHGRLPSPDDLVAALRGRLSAEQVAKRLRALRSRYDNAAIRLKRGIIPPKDGDVTIYRLSKLIWADTRTGKREKKNRAPDAREDPRGFDELTELYPCLSAEAEANPCLSAEAEAIDAECGYGALKRAFGRIGDGTAARLEAKLKRQRVAEARARAKLDKLRTNVAKALQGFIK